MDRIVKSLSGNLTARVAILGTVIAIALIAAIPFVVPAGFGSKFAYFLGYLTPAILLGAIVGWLAFNRTIWLVITACGLVICIGLFGRDVGFDYFWKEPRPVGFYIERGAESRLTDEEVKASAKRLKEAWSK